MSPRLFALIPAAVAVNLVIGRLVAELALPVYLDTLGTLLVSALAGLSGGLLVGTLSQLLAGMLSGYQWIAFLPIQWLIAVVAVWATRRGGFRTTPRAVGWGLLCGLLAGLASAAIAYVLFRGVTAGGVTAVGTLLRALGAPLPVAVTAASVATDLLDKSAAFAVTAALLRALPRRVLGRFPDAAQGVGR